MRAFITAALAAAAIAHAPVYAQERRLEPVDEGAGDVTWQRFRKQLVAAVGKRDRRFLLSILDRNVRNQDERARGVATFRKQWELDVADTPVWRELAAALQLGSAFITRDKRRELCVPYLLGRWPEDVSPIDAAVIVGRDVAVHVEPSNASPAIGRASYDIVEVSDWEIDDQAPDAKQKWIRIRYQGRDGYIPEERVRSPIEQAACFVKAGGSWRMSGFAPAGGE